MVLMRAMSLRTCLTRAVFSSWPVAFWKRRLNCSFFRAASSSASWSGVLVRISSAFIFLALPLAHADLGRLRGDGHVREHTDPDAALALHLAGDRTARSLDLARGDAVRFHRL